MRNGSAAPVVLLFSYVVLLMAWIVSNPPFAAPDEPDHYLRALGIAGGELRGRPVENYEPADYEPADAIEDVRVWYETVAPDIRSVSVPAGLYARGVACNALHRERSAACLDNAERTTERTRQVTFVSPYEPAPYLLPGVLARAGSDVPLIAAGDHFVAWTWNAHRHAVGAGGPRFFLSQAEWSPPLGWWTWAAVAAMGTSLMIVAGVLLARGPRGCSP
jgi:hypothetical protein